MCRGVRGRNMLLTPMTAFGAAAVTVMLVAYALERRGPGWVLLFAAACAASSLYGWISGAWPFGVVEAVWAGVAVRRWRQVVTEPLWREGSR